MAAFEDAIKKANDLIDNPNATVNMVKAEISSLLEAIGGFEDAISEKEPGTGLNQRSVTVTGLEEAPSAATLTITRMDGVSAPQAEEGPWTWVQEQPGLPGDGPYDWTASFDYLLPEPGLYRFAWVTQGPGFAPPPEFESVREFISIVSMRDVKQHLNKISRADDDELARYLMAATELVEVKSGKTLVPRRERWRVDGTMDSTAMTLVLPFRPIMQVVSVTSVPTGQEWGPLDWDAEAGLVYQAGMLTPFAFGPWDVEALAGVSVVEERFTHACLEQVRHLWETQRGSQPPALLQGEEVFTATSGWSFSVPRRVLELIEQDMVPSI
jgi:uncharacterized phiE125 gp8 family phage protein